jgi:hypothetical protein
MKTLNSIIGLALIAFMTSCSSTKITTDMDKATNFNEYKTYQLKQYEGSDSENGIILNELNRKRIISAIEEQAMASGMTTSDNPDAYLIYGIGIDIKKGYYTNTHHTGSPYYGGRYGRRGGGYYGGGFSSSYSTTTETQTTYGTISIALIDAETDELLWISHGTKEINQKSKKAEENINKSIAKMFKEFPIEHNFPLENPELISQNQ